MTCVKVIDIVFDAPPGPNGSMFIEVEDEDGKSIKIGKWVHRPDGNWALRLPVMVGVTEETS